MPDLHVAPSGGGEWEVKTAEGGEVLSKHASKEEAEIHAKQLARERGGGEIRVHDREGHLDETESAD